MDEEIENTKFPGEDELKADEYFNIKENNIERARRYTSSEVIKETNVVQGEQDYSWMYYNKVNTIWTLFHLMPLFIKSKKYLQKQTKKSKTDLNLNFW